MQTLRSRPRLVPRSLLLLAAASLALVGCGGGGETGEASSAAPQPAGGDGPMVVVATTTIVGDLVANVAGTDVDLQVLMPPGTDPHDFQPSARQREVLADADLVVANGAGLEEGLAGVIESAAAEGTTVLELVDQLDPLDEAGAGEHGSEDGDAEGEHGHGHEGVDPHFWHDPLRMAQAAQLVADHLEQLDGSGGWQGAADDYVAALEALDAEIAETLSVVPEEARLMVTNHDAFRYFADRYGFEVLGTVIPGTSSMAEPSASHLRDLAALIEREGIKAIFVEDSASTELAEALVSEVDGSVSIHRLHSESLDPDVGPVSYEDLMRTNAATVAEALGPAAG